MSPPHVSIIIPCLNEGSHIQDCLLSVLGGTYPPADLEILVVDGLSEDGTRAAVSQLMSAHPQIHLLDNPKRATPCALNIGVANAKGEILIRMDAHTTYERTYVEVLVKALETTGAENVGGVWKIVPRSDGLSARAIAAASSHPFGVGNARYRQGPPASPIEVDTVPFFCVRKELFTRTGMFNEQLRRGQDMEFSLRIKRAGGRVMLVPDAVSYYRIRSELWAFIQHNIKNGTWAILPFLYAENTPVSPRHLIPMLFAAALFLCSAGYVTSLLPGLPLMLLGGAYSLAALLASFHLAWSVRDFALILPLPFIFAALHLSYGTGSIWGLCLAGWYFLGNRGSDGKATR